VVIIDLAGHHRYEWIRSVEKVLDKRLEARCNTLTDPQLEEELQKRGVAFDGLSRTKRLEKLRESVTASHEATGRSALMSVSQMRAAAQWQATGLNEDLYKEYYEVLKSSQHIVRGYEIALELKDLKTQLATTEDRKTKTEIGLGMSACKKELATLGILGESEEPSVEVIISKCMLLPQRMTAVHEKMESLLAAVTAEGDRIRADKIISSLEELERAIRPVNEIVQTGHVRNDSNMTCTNNRWNLFLKVLIACW